MGEMPGTPWRRAAVPAVLCMCLAFYVINNGIWLALDASSPSYDKAAHAKFALEYLRLFEAPSRLSLTKLLIVTEYWPPFFHLASVPITITFGFSVSKVAATNFLFLPVAVFSIYAIGRHLFDEWVGVGAVVLTLLYPIVYALSRTVLVDFALLAMVALTVHVVLTSDGGLNPRRSWALGLVAGAAMLTKWTAVVFFLGPTLLWVARTIRRDRPRVVTVIAALALAMFTFAIVALPWYVRSFDTFVKGARVALGSDPAQEGDPVQVLASLEWYGRALRDQLVLTPLLIATLAGLLACVWRRSRAGLLFLACWILPPLVFFVLIPNKDGRFIVPALPAVALLAAAGIQSMRWRYGRAALWALVVAAGVLQFYAVSFAWPVMKANFYTGPPQHADWKVGEIVRAIGTMGSPAPILVAVLANDPNFEPNLFILEAAVGRLPMKVDGIGHELEPVETLDRYNAIVSKSGRISPRYSAASRPALRKALARWVSERRDRPRIVLWRTWPLPDGSRAEVYRVRHDAGIHQAPARGTPAASPDRCSTR
jgi:4-amino-4-deoxy-L-arabinose transferase-like glycosyltransferase